FYVSTSYNLFDGCEGDRNGGFGLQIYQGNAAAGSASYNVVRGGAFHDNGVGGVVVGTGTGNQIYNNLLYNNPSNAFIEYGASGTVFVLNTCANATNARDFAVRIGYSGGATRTLCQGNIVWA